ncbi:hypothetical protein SAMN05444372_11255 [Flavobacterium micromati]|jgi:hypothetical protein|uniref:Uncharacterized protein n=1 Tax=Flavobacterium micromati TaxID=229205 RepID=A0A1M5P478_9FLAO|nr:hypothetical protein [Flavobacterium micromati]SHG96507.1 hypothetical protein SAMN05444372_11255 [Flavobacterium micromati]
MKKRIFSIPRNGEMPPDFEAVTTTGKIKFSDYNKRLGSFSYYSATRIVKSGD